MDLSNSIRKRNLSEVKLQTNPTVNKRHTISIRASCGYVQATDSIIDQTLGKILKFSSWAKNQNDYSKCHLFASVT